MSFNVPTKIFTVIEISCPSASPALFLRSSHGVPESMSLVTIFRASSLGIALILPTLEDGQQRRVVLSQPIQNVLGEEAGSNL